MTDIKKVCIVGCGVIGAGWVARLLNLGIDVIATDPGEGAEGRLRDAIDNAAPALAKLTLVPPTNPGTLTFTTDLEAAAAGADYIQENAPEREDIKRDLLGRVSKAAGPNVIIASSSSGLLPSRIQADCVNPERVLIGHPFNPVYLLPLVEVVGGDKTSDDALDRATVFYESIGMHPLRVRNEIDGYISDRLQEALWRETLHMVNDGIATTDEIDQAVIYGPGLRWAFMGTCLTFHLAGGNDGMRHMLAQFGPALKLPWSKLVAPELTDELIERMAEGTEAQADGMSIAELAQLRDNCLIALMQALKTEDYASGHTLRMFEENQYGRMEFREFSDADDFAQPLRLHQTQVRTDWVDYNGHMTESRYLHVFGDASDALFRYLGIDDDYRASGYSYYTAETHLMNQREVAALEPVYVTTQLLHVDEKRLHLMHTMHHGATGEILSTAEQMLLHVDMEAGKACPAKPEVLEKLQTIKAGHQTLPAPAAKGRYTGMPRDAA